MHYAICICRNFVNFGQELNIFLRKKTVSMKSIHDLEDSFSDRRLWFNPCLLPEMYVFTLVRKRGVICATCTCIYKVFTRHLNVECFEPAVPAIFLSYAPTMQLSHWVSFLEIYGFNYYDKFRFLACEQLTFLCIMSSFCGVRKIILEVIRTWSSKAALNFEFYLSGWHFRLTLFTAVLISYTASDGN